MADTLEDNLWVEKYRPKTIGECILPQRIKDIFNGIKESGVIPNLLLSGSAGTGKTSVAKALCNELDCEVLFINGSSERAVDTLRTKITAFCSTVSVYGQQKVVLIDEADHLTDLFQAGLRSFIEQFYKNARFIFTCNFPERFMNAIKSRFSNIDFTYSNEEKLKLSVELFKRLKTILTNEGVEFEPEPLVKHIQKHFPDFRRIIGELQTAVIQSDGKLTAASFGNENTSIDGFIETIKNKDFGACQKWIIQNLGLVDQNTIYRSIYNRMYNLLDKESNSIPVCVILLDEYADKASRSIDPVITMSAFAVRCMEELTFKE